MNKTQAALFLYEHTDRITGEYYATGNGSIVESYQFSKKLTDAIEVCKGMSRDEIRDLAEGYVESLLSSGQMTTFTIRYKKHTNFSPLCIRCLNNTDECKCS